MRKINEFDFLLILNGTGRIARNYWLQILLFCWLFGASIFGLMLRQEQRRISSLLLNLDRSIDDEFYSLYKESKKGREFDDNSSAIVASKLEAVSLAIESLDTSISILNSNVLALKINITSDHR